MRNRVTYVDAVVAFDTETTSFTDEGVKRAIVYSYCVQVEDDIRIMRTEEEFVDYMQQLATKYDTDPMHRLVVYVHNLAYEWQFIKNSFAWLRETVFSNGSTLNVIRACTADGIEFRCSLALTNAPLKTVGKMVGVPKMVGDLDYDLVRHSGTPLTPEEIGYIENDTRIIVALIRERLADDTFESIPMTKTGYVRRLVRKVRAGSSKGAKEYRKKISKLLLTAETYSVAREAFAGGFTHANGMITGEELHDVVAYDLSSSYPAALVQFPYPMSAFIRVEDVEDVDHFERIVKGSCAIVDVTLCNISSRYNFPTISESKAREVRNGVIDNGRIWMADRVRVVVTNVDLAVIRRCYEIGSVEVNGIWVAQSDYLPTPFVEAVASFYRDKTTLKGIEGMDEEYRLAKENANSIWGMVATDPYRTEYYCGPDLTITAEVGDLESAIDNHNNDKKRVLFYPWGTFCTAYARFVLQSAIFDMEDAGVTVAYCDTDSIYAVDHPAVAEVVARSNEAITARMEAAAAAHGWDEETAKGFISPADKDGHTHPLGFFECETPEPLFGFKTLGAKRYAKQSAKGFAITVAGLSKAAAEYVEDHGGFEFFADGMTIDEDHSGRLTHSYSDDEFSNILIDYLGQPAEVHQHGYVHLEKVPYHMGISTEYDAFLEALCEGRLG